MPAMYGAFARPAMIAGQECRNRVPFSMHPMCMAATPDFLLIGTGVLASVSLFVPVLIVANLLLVSLVVLISLILISLTGFCGLVGLVVGLDPSASQGD
jgi:hypothetical protein